MRPQGTRTRTYVVTVTAPRDDYEDATFRGLEAFIIETLADGLGLDDGGVTVERGSDHD